VGNAGADIDGDVPAPSGCTNDRPVPGALSVMLGPLGPAVTRIGPTPTDVLMPLGDSVKRTPGIGEKLCRNLQPMFILPLQQMLRGRERSAEGDTLAAEAHRRRLAACSPSLSRAFKRHLAPTEFGAFFFSNAITWWLGSSRVGGRRVHVVVVRPQGPRLRVVCSKSARSCLVHWA